MELFHLLRKLLITQKRNLTQAMFVHDTFTQSASAMCLVSVSAQERNEAWALLAL